MVWLTNERKACSMYVYIFISAPGEQVLHLATIEIIRNIFHNWVRRAVQNDNKNF